MQRDGTWIFIDQATGNRSTAKITTTQPSKIKAAFDTANTALSPASHSTLIGIDPRGQKHFYASSEMGKKFDR